MSANSTAPSAQLGVVNPSWVDGVNRKQELAPPVAICPTCNGNSKRHSIRLRRIREINLDSPCTIEVRVGVYHCRTCNKFFRLQPDFVERWKHYSHKAIQKARLAVGADKTTFCGLQKRLARDFNIRPSISTGYRWFHEAADEIDLVKDYETWAVQGFSGVLALDELYDGFAVLVATDPLNDRTLSVRLCQSANEQELLQFLLHLNELGVKPQIVVTDGSQLYRNIPRAVWPTVRHQLCVFHYLRTITDHVLDAARSAREVRWPRVDYRDLATLRKNRYLFVTHPRHLTNQQVQLLNELCERNPAMRTIRRFMHEVFVLFEPRQTKADVLARYKRLLQHRAFQSLPHLRKALRALQPEKFERAITYLDYENCPRTTNHVERANRYYRKRAKSHYRNRTKRAIWNMIKCDLMLRRFQSNCAENTMLQAA